MSRPVRLTLAAAVGAGTYVLVAADPAAPAIAQRHAGGIAVAVIVLAISGYAALTGGLHPPRRRPLLLLLDDLDRCSADRVVRLLETVHTLLREPTQLRFLARRRAPAPLIVVVLADGRWVRRAFETVYADFASLGSPVRDLGADFLQKVFDHVVLVPALSGEQTTTYLDATTGTTPEALAERAARRAASSPPEVPTAGPPAGADRQDTDASLTPSGDGRARSSRAPASSLDAESRQAGAAASLGAQRPGERGIEQEPGDGAIRGARIRAANGDADSLADLVTALIKQGRFDEALPIVHSRADAGDEWAGPRLAELLYDLGDLDALQARADDGDHHSAAVLDSARTMRDEVEQLIADTPVGELHGDTVRAALDAVPARDREHFAEEIAAKAASPQGTAAFSEHLLTRYAAVMPSNPRLVKRVANTYGMLNALGLHLGHHEDQDTVGRAAILFVRYPGLVDQLLTELDPPITGRVPGLAPDPANLWLRPDVQLLLTRADGSRVDITGIARCFGREHAAAHSSGDPHLLAF